MKQSNTIGRKLTDTSIHLFLLILSVVTFAPMLYVLVFSFLSPLGDGYSFSVDGYKYVFSTRIFPTALGVSGYITIMGTFLSLLITTFMAYSLAHRELLGRRFFMVMVISTMIFSGGMIPTYFVVRQTGLMNSYWALMIPNLINTFNMIVLKNFFQSIPKEMEESAIIDGCHEIRIFFWIIVPLSLPAIAAFGLFYAVARWNQYLPAILYVQDTTKWPVQVLLRQVIFVTTGSVGEVSTDANRNVTSETIINSVIIISTIPILLIYPFLQKHFTKGVMLGSVKG
jgi:putative aldouronate transport system permease protein